MSDGGIEDEGLIYPCSKCDVIYRSASHLRKHTYDVHHDRELVCEICDFKVNTRRRFDRHQARCKEITKLVIFKCDQCEFTCQSQKRYRANHYLATHVKAKHEGVLYSCDVCDHKTQYKSNMEQHKEYKHRTKSIHCSNCDYKTSTKRALTRHVQNMHTAKIFECEKCSFRAGSHPQLNNHRRKAHTQAQESFVQEKIEFLVKCLIESCKNRISNSCEEASHSIITCNICGERFESKRAYKIHNSVTHMSDNVKQFECEQCEKRFSRLETLKLHSLGQHMEKTFSCNSCDFKTFTNRKLLGHMKIKHNEGNMEIFLCNACEFKCLYNGELIRHVRSKHKKIPISCNVCSKEYLDRRSLRDHVKKHGSRPIDNLNQCHSDAL